MPDWDEDSPKLRENLIRVMRDIRGAALQRDPLGIDSMRHWHQQIMRGLRAPDPNYIGLYRGERGLEAIEVNIRSHWGTPARDVADELAGFGERSHRSLQRLDAEIAPGADLTADQLNAVLHTCAWAHSEWVRIHPFANGNGRTARPLANAIALRYGLPAFVRLRPRPNHGYERAADASMRGDHRPLTVCFRRMLSAFLSGEV